MMNPVKWLKDLRDFYLVKVKWRHYQIGAGFHAGRQVFLYGKHSIRIGKNFYIGRFSEIGSRKLPHLSGRPYHHAATDDAQ